MIDALHTLVAAALAPVPVIWAYQNGQRPPKPYATIQATQTQGEAHPTQLPVDANGDIVVVEHRTVRVEVNVFGPEAHAIASRAPLRLRLPSLLDRADMLGVGLGPMGRAMDIPALLNASQYEERGMVEFTAYVVASERDRVGLIDHVHLQDMTPQPTPPFWVHQVEPGLGVLGQTFVLDESELA